jgi:hypothetical protein
VGIVQKNKTSFIPMVRGNIPMSEGNIPLFFQGTNVLGTVVTCAYATLRQSVANLTFRNVSFNFATAVRKRIAKGQTFSLFALSELVFSLFSLSELVCTKNVFYPILLFPLLSHPKLLPLWSVTDERTDREISTPPVT